ncbi:B9 domain-containing protein 2-like [Pollicipes pollicipes]|uniref:B9 domain-containing protein 2-like n=1 Tax=Pollicipes pollicipes TaxID=41117 RepID=UPI001885734A|nr:B9 domain-containing protein 2-like [Pollicipes pollicipes]XP_037090135.1 B9 domain-containing protein 2-like [Pollicipes pollicipes]
MVGARDSVQAEVHLIGQLLGGSGFPSTQLFCRWNIHTGGAWHHLEGLKEGQTQVDNPLLGDTAIWAHPIDVHYTVKGITGWPKLVVQVYSLDSFGRTDLCGYGFCNLPATPGAHRIDCVTWRPTGSLRDEFRQQFVGGGPQLRSPELVYTPLDRYRLQTVAMGTVHVQMNVILRNFEQYGIEY